ncbi:hypothetical protein KI387_022895, partial [Taxus chinensis]
MQGYELHPEAKVEIPRCCASSMQNEQANDDSDVEIMSEVKTDKGKGKKPPVGNFDSIGIYVFFLDVIISFSDLSGNKVVATCGGAEKEALLKDFGVDRVIDYKKEDIKLVLKKEFPHGVDIVYESVGGEMFNACLNALAVHGHLVVIGMISQYQGQRGWQPSNYTGLCEKLLFKSQSVAGFFLMHYTHLWHTHLERLYNLFGDRRLKAALDPKQFLGVKSVADAVEYLHSGQSMGK